MKNLAELHYYEILQIPANASSKEIKQAYDEAISMYSDDSMATYALFSTEDRDELLLRIEEAYSTLIDDSKRAAYDRELFASGQIDDPALWKELPKSVMGVPNQSRSGSSRLRVGTSEDISIASAPVDRRRSVSRKNLRGNEFTSLPGPKSVRAFAKQASA